MFGGGSVAVLFPFLKSLGKGGVGGVRQAVRLIKMPAAQGPRLGKPVYEKQNKIKQLIL